MRDLLTSTTQTNSTVGYEVGSLGPVVYPSANVAATSYLPFPALVPGETFNNITLAVIFQPRLMTIGQGMIGESSAGPAIKIQNGGSNNINLSLNNTGVLNSPAVAGHNYFAAMSYYPGPTNHRALGVIVDLTTGQMWTQGPSVQGGSSPVAGTDYAVLTYNVAGGVNPGRVAAVALSAKSLRFSELLEWAKDPWSLWYPDQARRLVLTPKQGSISVAQEQFYELDTSIPVFSVQPNNASLVYTHVVQQNYSLNTSIPTFSIAPQNATLTYVPTIFGEGLPAGSTATGSTPTVPLTMLEAVNEMLAAVGRGPITSLTQPDAGDEAEKAIAILGNASVQIQSKGWWFNSEYEWVIPASLTDGTIVLPPNVLTARNSVRKYPKQIRQQYDRHRTFTMRAVNGVFYLYDIANHTFSWVTNQQGFPVQQPLTTGNLAVDMVLAYSFEDIPEPIRWYITCKAGRDWAVGRVPDMNTYRFTDAVLQDAEADAINFDREMRPQVAEVNPHFKQMRRR